MTPEQIERREFTYCSAYYSDPFGIQKFLVGTPSLPEARLRANAYATAQWGEPRKVLLYPRTYVKKARALFADGRYEGAPSNPAEPPSAPPADEGTEDPGQLLFGL